DQIPAANEIGGQDVIRFSPGADPVQVAEAILKWTETSPVFHLRRRVRQGLTWRSLFQREILPLLDNGGA
ncbi:MAG TPA: hypothetical protein VK900_20040, partial [Anaerolineales bacterium]|nr:hypothetical protein [Anaerolineales bacterium]